jgi:hypothetical protein
MQSILIIVTSILAAVAYGIVHDQITARICVEYFTIAHPPVFGTDDPTLLGLGWGIIATWWAGLMLGVPLAIAARAGSRPKRSMRSLVRPICTLLAVMAASALLAGVIGWFLARSNVISPPPRLAVAIPAEKHVPFMADAWAHMASYAAGFLGGIAVIVLVWRSRKTLDRPLENSPPHAAHHADS